MERNARKVRVGKVVSAGKSQKTIIVAVDTYKKNTLYSKRYKSTKRFAVHDEKQEAGLNDIVVIMETRPLSKTKHFRLVSIKEKAQTSQGDN
ncbi:30S ribosomal protein S17 [Mycoplasmopsis anatis]|uniref:Small ribosomal subunit protein uS17 n=2 Tax=Mycoplasmopsis anatis TaxID=171279 RepID=F9QD39_9BACT|nr:30S ribosomal protein S17 [Mycoplasmopsis anatis]EGS29297.1 30S ribosomal protein S17 [Mycoplasmopsis anatis 1340]AWX70263.1 30S ribosomal protein S17 [Mycoplasmopsis anatis]MBW0596217.1 30S ribosomal protein S17 [Mycoplasmopsis anatis]MBW0596502.1 30S ribosomal protein S17 [Mycoplasmopsis anatis]MBW0597702.1 30S ribosomal protein S17 [Mycoplasmopsis anatis]